MVCPAGGCTGLFRTAFSHPKKVMAVIRGINWTGARILAEANKACMKSMSTRIIHYGTMAIMVCVKGHSEIRHTILAMGPCGPLGWQKGGEFDRQ